MSVHRGVATPESHPPPNIFISSVTVYNCTNVNRCSMADIKLPHTNYGACHIRAGAILSEISEPDRKLLPAPPEFEKNIALAFLKAA